MGNHLVKSNSLELRALSLVSATLKIEYAMEFYENTIGEIGNEKSPHEIQFPRKNGEPCLWFLLQVGYAGALSST